MSSAVRAHLIHSAMNNCRHFDGSVRETCKAGVNYRQLVGGPDLGWALRLPCLARRTTDLTVERVPCDQRSVCTQAEAEQKANRHLERMERLARALAAAKDDARINGFKNGRGGAGEIACPICDGRLRYSVAGVNGHMWARCDTAGCVSWME